MTRALVVLACAVAAFAAAGFAADLPVAEQPAATEAEARHLQDSSYATAAYGNLGLGAGYDSSSLSAMYASPGAGAYSNAGAGYGTNVVMSVSPSAGHLLSTLGNLLTKQAKLTQTALVLVKELLALLAKLAKVASATRTPDTFAFDSSSSSSSSSSLLDSSSQRRVSKAILAKQSELAAAIKQINAITCAILRAAFGVGVKEAHDTSSAATAYGGYNTDHKSGSIGSLRLPFKFDVSSAAGSLLGFPDMGIHSRLAVGVKDALKAERKVLKIAAAIRQLKTLSALLKTLLALDLKSLKLVSTVQHALAAVSACQAYPATAGYTDSSSSSSYSNAGAYPHDCSVQLHQLAAAEKALAAALKAIAKTTARITQVAFGHPLQCPVVVVASPVPVYAYPAQPAVAYPAQQPAVAYPAPAQQPAANYPAQQPAANYPTGAAPGAYSAYGKRNLRV